MSEGREGEMEEDEHAVHQFQVQAGKWILIFFSEPPNNRSLSFKQCNFSPDVSHSLTIPTKF